MRTRRSDAGRLLFLSLFALLALLVAGCVSVEEVIEEKYPLDELAQPLSAGALDKRMSLIDEQFGEPRTPASVAHSLETAEGSISPNNDYDALWRGIRACAWLTQNHPDRAEREKFGEKGIRMGKKAINIEKLTVRPEPWYYLALCMGAYFDVKGTPDVSSVREMRDHAKMAAALDETFDHCGPHRFLGKLITETADTPGYAQAPFQTGLDHLRTAVQLCPDFPENHLFLAEALIEYGKDEEAAQVLDRVLKLGPPPDHLVEHRNWLNRAAELLNEVAVDDEVSGEAAPAAFEIPGEQ